VGVGEGESEACFGEGFGSSGARWSVISVWGLVRLGADDEVASCACEPSAFAHAACSDGVSIWAMAGIQDGLAEGPAGVGSAAQHEAESVLLVLGRRRCSSAG